MSNKDPSMLRSLVMACVNVKCTLIYYNAICYTIILFYKKKGGVEYPRHVTLVLLSGSLLLKPKLHIFLSLKCGVIPTLTFGFI